MPPLDATSRNQLGVGGAVGAQAREAAADAFARIRSLLETGSPLSAAPAMDAAELALRGSDKALRASAVSRLHSLVRDPKVPDATAVRAAGLLLVAGGKRSYRGKN